MVEAMKKNPPVKAHRARREPEQDQTPHAVVPEPAKAEPKRKRFHTSVYLNRQTYDQIRIGLLKEGDGRDFNGLVSDLLKEWYAMVREAHDLDEWQDEEKTR